jgi:hypothetical protein
VFFFEANTSGGQVSRVDQPDGTFRSGILIDQWLE